MREVARKGILTAVATGSVLASTAGYAYAGADAHGLAAGSPGVASGNTVQVPVEAPVNLCGNTVDVVGLLNPAYGNQCANDSGHPGGHGGQGGGSDTGGNGPVTGGGTSGGSSAGNGPSAGGGTSGDQGSSGDSGSSSSGSSSNGPSAGSGSSSNGPSAGNGPFGGGSSLGSGASGASQGSPGVLSGNTTQVPVSAPVNLCGDTVDVVGAANPAFGNDCVNHEAPAPHQGNNPPPPQAWTPPAQPAPTGVQQSPTGELAPQVSAESGTRAPVAAPVAHGQLASTGAEGLGLIAPAGLALLIGGGVLYRRSRAAA